MAEIVWSAEYNFPVKVLGDLSRVRQRVRDSVEQYVSETDKLDQLLLVINELGTNLLNHAGGGEFYIRLNQEQNIVEMETVDYGPGILHIDMALEDGYSSRKSLGCGLGTINRIMDELNISSVTSDGATRVRCLKHLGSNDSRSWYCPFEVGVVSRSLSGNKFNGDGFIVSYEGNQLLTGVIDGLGHGIHAHKATERVRKYVLDHSCQPLANIFAGADREARGTRGVVMALARFNWNSKPVRIEFASVGNITVKGGGGLGVQLPVSRGIVGNKAPEPKVFVQSYQTEEPLYMFSDGIRFKWEAGELEQFECLKAEELASKVLTLKARNDDDATMVVIKNKKTFFP